MRRLLLVLAACSAKQPLHEVHVPLHPHVVHLANGLTAILVPDRQAEQAQLLSIIRAGAVDEPAPSVAHVAAHLSYAPNTAGMTRWERLDRVAIDIDTQPGTTQTTFGVRFLPSHLADVLAVEAQRLSVGCDAASARWLPDEQAQIAGELLARPSLQLERDVAHALLADPLARAYDATPESPRAVDLAQACGFLDRYYVPANATIVVWGPFEPEAFEQAIRARLAALPGGTRNPRGDGLAIAAGTSTEVATEVIQPAVAVTYALPADPGERTVMELALELLAVKIDATVTTGDRLGTLWFARADGALAKLTAAVESGLVEAKDFASVRARRASELLQHLDATGTRMTAVAESPDLDAPFTALANLTARGLAQLVVTHLGLVHARVVKLVPSGRNRFPAWPGEHRHALRGPSNFAADPTPPAAPVASPTLARARTVVLANGLTAILMPSSAIPLVQVELAFLAGTAEETGEPTGAAYLAAGALEQAIERVHPDSRGVIGAHASNADLETVGVTLRAPTGDAAQLIAYLDAVEAPLLDADQQKRRDEMARWPAQRATAQIERISTTAFGPDHPYGRRARMPSTAVDAASVRAFAQRFFQPNNAVLIVTGGFDPDAIEPLVHRTFDAWRGVAQLPPPVAMRAVPTAYAIEESGPGVSLDVIWQGAMMDDRYEARMLLSYILGSESYASVQYSQLRQGGFYRLDASFAPEHAPAQIGNAMRAVRALAGPPERPSFAIGHAQMTRWFLDGGASADGWAQLVLFAVQNHRDTRWLADLAKRIDAVTYADVSALARDELVNGRATVTVRGPRAAVEAVYAALGVAPTWL